MYKKGVQNQKIANSPYFLDTTLNTDNDLVKLANLIPWSNSYALYFKSDKEPQVISARTVFGFLII